MLPYCVSQPNSGEEALTIAETRHVVGLGDIPPEHVHTPGPFVHRVIHVPE